MNDKMLGYIIFIGSLFGVGLYFYLMFMSPWILLALQASAFLAVSAVLVVIAWIGYLLAIEPSVHFEKESLKEENLDAED